MAVWEQDDCGTSSKWIRRVIEDFRTEGTKDRHSAECLTMYVSSLSKEILNEMYIEDPDTTLEIMINCFGAKGALLKYREAIEGKQQPQEEEVKDRLKQQGWLDRDQITEIEERHRKQIRNIENEIDQQRQRTREEVEQVNQLDNENNSLKQQIIELKARLYDAYEDGFEPHEVR